MAMGLNGGPMIIRIPDNPWVHVWMLKNVSTSFLTGLGWASQWWKEAEIEKVRGTRRFVRVFHMHEKVALKLYLTLKVQLDLNAAYIQHSDRCQVDALKTDHYLRSIKAAFDVFEVWKQIT